MSRSLLSRTTSGAIDASNRRVTCAHGSVGTQPPNISWRPGRARSERGRHTAISRMHAHRKTFCGSHTDASARRQEGSVAAQNGSRAHDFVGDRLDSISRGRVVAAPGALAKPVDQVPTSRPGQSAWQRLPGTATRFARLGGLTRSSGSDEVRTGLGPLGRGQERVAAEGWV